MLMRILSTIFLSCLMLTGLWAQGQELWQSQTEASIPVLGVRYIQPQAAAYYQLDLDQLQQLLDAAPMEFRPIAQMSQTLISLPMPDGSMQRFDIQESPIMEAALSERFPDIQTFNGRGVTDPSKSLRFDLTPAGFHAMILQADGPTIFIDPVYFKGDKRYYQVYYRSDFRSTVAKNFSCQTETPMSKGQTNKRPLLPKSFGSCELRTYRLALAATGEYTQFHGGTVADALAAQVVSMNRVNAVYERDLAVRMVIVADNYKIIYTNGSTDPYSNASGGAMLGENQTICDDSIGTANYDIGHVFSTGGGGVAYLQSVCNNNKAGGVTGSANPIGDPFDIDYVAHEMGHQFGANHTQNNACNRNGATAMEPGSASTIMGYAGICAPNVQNNSDDHFHGVSLEEMGAFITSSGHSCPTTTPLANNSPVVNNSTNTLVIPANTPFFLTGDAQDQDTADVLTYCWEQMDNQTATMPPLPTSTVGPSFRSISPSSNPTRYFPNLADLSAGISPTWEVLSSVSRSYNFRLTVRDNASGGGCTDHVDLSVNVDANSGPFIINYPSATGISWIGTTQETVQWDVANTNNAPLNCTLVDILLSTDGGLTYPTVLATATPNDGSEVITVPNTPSSTCRIMVRASGGNFFDISDNDFEITGASFGYNLSVAMDSLAGCPNSNGSYFVTVTGLLGYTDPVQLSLTGLPTGATASFGNANITPSDTTTLAIALGNTAAGDYSLNLIAQNASDTQSLNLMLSVLDGSLAAPSPQQPTNQAQGVISPANFSWTASSSAGQSFSIEIATDANFSNIVESASNLSSPSYTSGNLSSNTTYYWRVSASNACSNSPNSAVFEFTTADCNIYAAADLPIAISASGAPTISSNINIPNAGSIIDLNVVNLMGTHSWVSDLTFVLSSPSNSSATLFAQICGSDDDFDLNFDDAAASSQLPCPPIGGGTYQAEDLLSVFNGQNPAGTWTLSVSDGANQDGGSLDSWGLQVCVAAPSNAHDAAILDITNLSGRYCNQGDFVPEIEIANFGASALTSLTINYTLDGGSPQSFNWSGNLATNATTTVSLPQISVAAGTHSYSVELTAPNGQTDGDLSNNTAATSFTYVSPGQDVTVAITTDNFGSETSWEILNAQNFPIASGGPYQDGTANQTFSLPNCLPEGCYTFIIYDSFGDGLNDGQNTGNFLLSDTAGTVLAEMGANFTDSTSRAFCIQPTAVEAIDGLSLFEVFPNPASQTCFVQLQLEQQAEQAQLSLVNTLGQQLRQYTVTQNWQQQIDLRDLPAGVYYLRLQLDQKQQSRKLIIHR